MCRYRVYQYAHIKMCVHRVSVCHSVSWCSSWSLSSCFSAKMLPISYLPHPGGTIFIYLSIAITILNFHRKEESIGQGAELAR